MKYLLLHYLEESLLRWDNDGQEDMDSAERKAQDAWDAEMKSRGILVGGGALRRVRETTTLRVRGGELLISDGPFAETKEQIAGYNILQCADLDEAIEVISRHPTAKIGTFELRPLIGMFELPTSSD